MTDFTIIGDKVYFRAHHVATIETTWPTMCEAFVSSLTKHGNYSEGYDDGYKQGHDDGTNNGYKAGREAGKDDAVQEMRGY